jgi:hypothetical protein
LNDAIAAGSFKPAAQPCCLLNRRKGTDKNSIVGALRTEIRAANDQLAAAKLVGVFRLQRRERGLSIAFVALRRNLNRITTACDTRGYRRWAVRFGRCDGDGSHLRAARGSRDVCPIRLASALGRNGNATSRPPRIRARRQVRHCLVWRGRHAHTGRRAARSRFRRFNRDWLLFARDQFLDRAGDICADFASLASIFGLRRVRSGPDFMRFGARRNSRRGALSKH